MGFKLYPRKVVANATFLASAPTLFLGSRVSRDPLNVRISFQPCQASAEKNQPDVNMGERKTAP